MSKEPKHRGSEKKQQRISTPMLKGCRFKVRCLAAKDVDIYIPNKYEACHHSPEYDVKHNTRPLLDNGKGYDDQ